MEAEWTDAEITKLIEFYETNPMLYDPVDANYRNRDLKREKENEIAAILGKPGKRTRRRRRVVGSRRFCGYRLVSCTIICTYKSLPSPHASLLCLESVMLVASDRQFD